MDAPQDSRIGRREPDPELREAPAVKARFHRALNLSLLAIVLLAGVFFLQMRGLDTQALSIVPQDPGHWLGIVTAPLLHGSLGHLGANAFAVLVLGTLAGTVFPRASWRALPLIWLGSGLGTWLIGTGGSHIGASGVTHGLGFLVFTLGILRRDRPAVAASLIAFFFFGGMLVTVFPNEIGVSWEYHLAGAVSGLLAGVLWRRADPTPARPRYSWDEEEELRASAGRAAQAEGLELPSPDEVPVIWQPPLRVRGVVLPFRHSGQRVANDDSVT
jgi:membrane associated rhomboid family serine protease